MRSFTSHVSSHTMDSQLKPKASRNRRHFVGNINYVSYYNKVVSQFFNEPIDDIPASRIKGTECIYDGSSTFKNDSGCLWNAEEKRRFFKSLSRNSIHRADIIAEEVKSKSIAEVLAYYHFLKLTLDKVKASTTLKSQMVKNQKRFYHEPNTQLVSYSEMPFSIELSPAMEKLEEAQLMHIIRKQYAPEADRVSLFAAISSLDDIQVINKDAFKSISQFQRELGDFNRSKRLDITVPYKPLIFVESLVKLKVRQMITEILRQSVHYDQPLRIDASFVKNLFPYTSKSLARWFTLRGRPGGKRKVKTHVPVEYEPVIWNEPFVEDQLNLSVDLLPLYDVVQPDEDYDFELFAQETHQVDELDIIESENQNHILLTFLSTCNYEQIKNSMWTDEELEHLEDFDHESDEFDESHQKNGDFDSTNFLSLHADAQDSDTDSSAFETANENQSGASSDVLSNALSSSDALLSDSDPEFDDINGDERNLGATVSDVNSDSDHESDPDEGSNETSDINPPPPIIPELYESFTYTYANY